MNDNSLFGAAPKGNRKAEDRAGQSPGESPCLGESMFRAGEGQPGPS